MKLPLQEPLPFPHIVLAPAAFEVLERFAINWEDRWRLVDTPQIDFVCVYIKHCSPEGAESLDLKPVAVYMLWLVALNDIPDCPDRLAVLNDIYDALVGNINDRKLRESTIARATIEFIDELHKRYTPCQTHRLRGKLCELIIATRDETMKAGRFLPLVDYLSLRERTIAAYPYIELFRLSLNTLMTSSHFACYERLEQLSVQSSFLVNDVRSVQRDIRKGKFNLVLCLAKERQISIEAALEEALIMTNEKLQELASLSQELLATEQDEAARRYVAFLGSIQEGNRVATLELHERYFGNG